MATEEDIKAFFRTKYDPISGELTPITFAELQDFIAEQTHFELILRNLLAREDLLLSPPLHNSTPLPTPPPEEEDIE